MHAHLQILEFAQKSQAQALVWVEADPMGTLTHACDLIVEIPGVHRDDDRAALAMILRRVAAVLFQPERPCDWRVDGRMRRAQIGDVHVTRAITCIRREFVNPALDLRAVANVCRLLPPYLSDLIAAKTHHGFHVHLATIRILNAAHLLATTPLSTKEIAYKSGFKSSSALDHKFRKRFHMTPGEFRRWA